MQFGLAGDPQVQTRYHRMGNLVDDPPWLPLGPPGREINGIKRYQKGYLGYAGAGKNSRGTQLILAFQPNIYLGGGSPWEVIMLCLLEFPPFERPASLPCSDAGWITFAPFLLMAGALRPAHWQRVLCYNSQVLHRLRRETVAREDNEPRHRIH